MTLEKVYERNKAIQNQWLNLPEKVRMEFNNDVNEFVDRGQQWLNKKREEAIKEKEKMEEAIKKTQMNANKINKGEENA